MALDVKAELEWLKKNPQFEERPASILEFLGPNYLNIEKGVRKAIKEQFTSLFGEKVNGRRISPYARAMITGGIGIGKTTIASVILPYMAHWVLCLKDPQGFFDLLPGSRIAFMQMSTSETQAKEVVFGDIKARIDHCSWFVSKYPYDRAFKNQLRFPKDIWILPGDSKETTFEGYNILGGILDEADSHQVTQVKDYAEVGFDTIHARISSRFQERGMLLVIGQMKKQQGFAARKFAELKKDKNAYVSRLTIWESLGWENFLNKDGTRNSFWYDIERHEIVPTGAATLVKTENLIEIPTIFKQDFLNNPVKALRDLAGIPPAVGSPFITLTYKVTEAVERWGARYGVPGIVEPNNRFARAFRAQDSLKRVMHLDIAYSADGDSLGIAMGHVPEVVDIDGERKPYIVIDFVMRLHANPGQEIFLGDVRRIIYHVKDELGFRVVRVTMDGFQSTDTRQQLQRRRIFSEVVSVDKNLTPYYDLRDAIHEDRIDLPKYLVRVRPDDTENTEILYKELIELIDNGNKIDHPEGGSKDVADAVAGVVYTLVGDRTYHRKVIRMDQFVQQRQEQAANGGSALPAGFPPLTGGQMGGFTGTAPLPPSPDPSLWHPKGV